MNTSFQLQGKTALVTGAWGRRLPALWPNTGQPCCWRAGATALPVHMDIQDPVGIIVCNAGVALTQPARDLSVADWNDVIGTNLSGNWWVAQEAARRLIAAKQPGTIIFITSILGHRVAGAVMPYVVAKAGHVHVHRGKA